MRPSTSSKPTVASRTSGRWASNFFDPAQIDAVKALISTALADAGSDCVRASNADFDGRQPDDSEGDAFKRPADANRRRLLLYGALARRTSPSPKSTWQMTETATRGAPGSR